MDLSVREGYARWRELGVRDGTAAAIRLARAELGAPVRRARLRLSPLRVSPSDLRTALGKTELRDLFRGRVLESMPTVATFERELDALSAKERADLLDRAELIAQHSFDLLGSGPTDLGSRIDWSRDFKSGRSWPLDHISRVQISYPDDSDIKVPWELSRFQHLPILAAAFRLTDDRRWLDEIGAQIEDWIHTNPVECGPNWACTMDVAIRAANWVVTLSLVADATHTDPWFEHALSSLLLHGRFIRSHLEWAEARGNHYLSDVVGLLYVAAVFADSSEGRGWAEWAAHELVRELQHQVRADGCDHEASIPYHRLVAELFLCGFQAASVLSPESTSHVDRERLDRMLRFVSDYTRPDGLAPQVGDADDGRFLPLADYGQSDPRSHLHLFRQAARDYAPATGHAAYPEGGYWIVRFGRLYLLVRCGDVGVGGSHAHNDALSFELALGDQSLVVDPGSYLYTADPAERNRFRSTGFHSTVELDDAEQNPISTEALFAMDDRRRAEALAWEAGPDRAVFTGRHHGYESLEQPAVHTREIEVRPDGSIRVTDIIESAGRHEAQWTFPLVPCDVTVEAGRALARFESGAELELACDAMEFYVEPRWLSPSYGCRVATPFVRARRFTNEGEDVTEITLSVHE